MALASEEPGYKINLLEWADPHTESTFKHIVTLCLLTVIQFTVLPRLPLPSQPDLITCWITLICIARPYQHSILFSVFGGLIYETHTTLPIGQMICLYLLLASLLRLVRSSLMWRTRKPWLVWLMAAQLLVISTEALVLISESGLQRLDWTLMKDLSVRLAFPLAVALSLPPSFLYLNQPKEEPL